jgi:drug/metabolite transporter (DMT)-like permease
MSAGGKIRRKFVIQLEIDLDIAAPDKKNTSSLTRGYLICLTGTILWSTTGVFIRYLTETYRLPPLVLAFWRDLFVAFGLVMVIAFLKPARLRVDRKHILFLIFFGFELSLFNSLWTISVALNGAAVATVLAYSSAAFTAVLGWRLFSESLGILKIFAVMLSLIGCIFVSGAYDLSAWQGNPVGVATGLLSGLAFAGYSLMGKAASRRGIYPWTTMLYSFAFAVPFLFSYNFFKLWLPVGVASTNFFWLGGALVGWLILFILAVGPTIGGYGLYTSSLAYLPASVANLIATLEPAMTAVLAYFLLGEIFTGPQWVGSLLIIGGVILLRMSEGNGFHRWHWLREH